MNIILIARVHVSLPLCGITPWLSPLFVYLEMKSRRYSTPLITQSPLTSLKIFPQSQTLFQLLSSYSIDEENYGIGNSNCIFSRTCFAYLIDCSIDHLFISCI